MLIVSGLAGGALLIAINLAVDEISLNQPNSQTWLTSVLLLLLAASAQYFALSQMAVSLEEALLKQRLLLAARLRYADLGYIEEIASAPTRSILVKDLQVVSQAVLPATRLIRSLAVIVVVLIYLVVISPVVAIASLALITFYLLVQIRYIQPRQARQLNATWAQEQIFFRYVQSLLDSIREIRQSRRASEEAFEQYNRLAGQMSDLKRGINQGFVREFSFGYAFFYLMLIGLVEVVPGIMGAWEADTVKLVAAIFYLLVELISLLGHFPVLAQANSTVDEITRLDGVIRRSPRFDAGGRVAMGTVPSLSSLQLTLNQFDYRDSKGQPVFSLGPIRLALKAGDWIVLTGANGCGKTTLLKILAGMLTEFSGSLSVNGQTIGEEDYPLFREFFAVAWPDTPGNFNPPVKDPRLVAHWLEKLKLNGKVSFADGKWSSHNLSTAQGKRLTLLKVILEDRPVLLLDGMDADQDTDFREYFYLDILPALKKQGKTLVIVSQDSHYFSLADRVWTLAQGKITE